MTDLLTCWSCGGKATLIEDEPTQGFCFVECVDCGSCGPITTKEQAIAAWNTRYHFGLTDEDYNILLDEMGIAKPERTCHLVQHGSLADYPQMVCWSCSECGFGWHHSVNDKQFSYCPNCGAKVVEQ